MKKTLPLVLLALVLSASMPFWGFYGHKKINRLAVFTLPAPMIVFYKARIHYIEEASVNPDKRRYAVEEEGARHYLDADHYGDSVFALLPRAWDDAIALFGEDSLREHGILPWHLVRMYYRLRDAFLIGDPAAILKTSAELGHYVADAHVPLHTTMNYNGQLTGQDGIHGFWESRLPELFAGEYDFFVGGASYLQDPQQALWDAVMTAHAMVPEVLTQERILAGRFGEKRFSFETRGVATVKVYAEEYARAYHRALAGMVEKQMRASIKMTGDLWFTAWVEAGQPDLARFIHYTPSAEMLQQIREELLQWRSAVKKGRSHD